MSSIKRIAVDDEIRNIWSKVFISNDPFSIPFRKEIKHFLLFYPTSPTNSYMISEKQYEMLWKTMDSVGERSCFVSVVETGPDAVEFCLDHKYNWELRDHPSFAEYDDLNIPLECAIYSKSSRWGLIVSHEDHAIIGGARDFMVALKEAYSYWDKDMKEIRRYWQGEENRDRSWLEEVLKKVEESWTL